MSPRERPPVWTGYFGWFVIAGLLLALVASNA
jgi:hypothetical protein